MAISQACFEVSEVKTIKKSNLYCTRGITQKRVTSGGAHLRDLVPGQHSCEATSQRWRDVGDTVSSLTGSGIEPQTFRTDSDMLKQLFNLILLSSSRCLIFGWKETTLDHALNAKNKSSHTKV